MSKKYKHLDLPARFISEQTNYEPPSPRLRPDEFEINYTEQKARIKKGVGQTRTYFEDKKSHLKLDEDKKSNEVKVAFYGYPNKNFVNKYRINVYKKQGENVIYGELSGAKLPGQEKTDFDDVVDHHIAELAARNAAGLYQKSSGEWYRQLE